MPMLRLIQTRIKIFSAYVAANDNSGFIFSLTKNKKLKLKNKERAINDRFNYGPTFGGGHNLWIYDKCNENNNSRADLANDSYEFPEGMDKKNKRDYSEWFTGQTDGTTDFKIIEYEVWEVQTH